MSSYRQIQQLFDPIYAKDRRHVTWGRLTNTIQKFQLMMEIEQNEIAESLDQIINRKIQYLQQFIDYKQTLGKNNKEEILRLSPRLLPKFFSKGYKEILTIIKFLDHHPHSLSRLLTHLPNFSSAADMALNLVGLYSSSYLLHQQTYLNSSTSQFFDAIMKDWKYSESLDKESIHTQIVLAVFKLPEAVKFIEDFYRKFNKEVIEDLLNNNISIDVNKNKCKQEVKRKIRQYEQKKGEIKKKQSFFSNFWKKSKKIDKDLGISMQPIQSSEEASLCLQKQRIQFLTSYIKKTVRMILSSQFPSIIKFLLKKFCSKLGFDHLPYTDIGNLFMKNWISAEIKQKLYSLNHPRKQQIKEMLVFIDYVFIGQFQKLNIDGYFFIPLKDQFQKEIEDFYHDLLNYDKDFPRIQLQDNLVNYQNSLKLMSFRDVIVLVNLVKAAQKNKDIQDPLASLDLNFSEDSIYEPKNKIIFKSEQYINQNIYFCIPTQTQEECIRKSYLGQRLPLKNLQSVEETLLRSNVPVQDALKISSSLQFLRGVESKLIVKAFEGLQTSYPNVTAGIPQLQKILNLEQKMNSLLLNKSLFLRFKQSLLGQFKREIQFIKDYINHVKAEQIYKKYVQNPIDNLQISIYVTIEKHKIRIQTALPVQYKKLQLASILMTTKVDSHDENVMNQILENSMKEFKRIPKLLQAISKLDITRKALYEGKNADQFNLSFRKMCDILLKKLEDSMKNEKTLIDINKQKKMFIQAISKIIAHNVYKTPHEYKKQSPDTKFLKQLNLIDIDQFKKNEVGSFNISDFAFDQAVKKFRNISNKDSPQAKLAQFELLIREILKLISLSAPSLGQSNDVLTPIINYIILKAKAEYSVRNACEIWCLCIQQSQFYLTAWRSALKYLREVSKKKESTTKSSTSCNSRDQ